MNGGTFRWLRAGLALLLSALVMLMAGAPQSHAYMRSFTDRSSDPPPVQGAVYGKKRRPKVDIVVYFNNGDGCTGSPYAQGLKTRTWRKRFSASNGTDSIRGRVKRGGVVGRFTHDGSDCTYSFSFFGTWD